MLALGIYQNDCIIKRLSTHINKNMRKNSNFLVKFLCFPTQPHTKFSKTELTPRKKERHLLNQNAISSFLKRKILPSKQQIFPNNKK